MMTKVKWWLGAMFAIVLVTNLQPMFLLSRDGDWSGLFARLVPVVVLVVVFAALLWLSPRLAARKFILRKVAWDLTEDDVHIDTEVSSGQLQWAAFQKYRETPKVFLLYIQKAQAQFIPKRVLSEEQLVELRGLLERHVKKG